MGKLDTKRHLNRWENRSEFCHSLNLSLKSRPFWHISKWTKDNQIAIYDPHDEEQCEQARTALGYAPDYIDDFDVCQTFNDLLCDPFFEDLEFLDNKAEKPSGFQQLVYTPIDRLSPGYKALFFEESTQPVWAFVIQAASAAVKSCEAGIFFKTSTIWAFKQILWALHYLAKVAYSATTWLLYQKSKKGTAVSRTYNGEEYTVGIYETLVQHDGWNHDALGVINSNMIKQHTQMRKELQNRHQDITNDVNQYTTCIANYLGTEIISRFPDTTVGPLNSLCRQLLGLTDRRRLEDGTEVHSDAPFNIDVSWGEESIVMQQQASMEMEIEILDKEERILKALSKIENAVGINCGNTRCEQEETNIGCPLDCANAESTVLSTTEETMASGFDKIKFTILAKRKVAITALSFFTKDALEESNVKISTMAGTYTNSLFSLDKWQNVLGTTVTTTAYSTGTASLMKFEFEGIQIVVEGGQCQSFEVYSDSAIMVQMSTNMTEGDVAYEDDALQIFTGGVMEDHSPKPIQFNGVIEYDGLARVPEISGSNSQGGIAMDQASATDLVLEQEMKSTKRKIAAIQRKVGQIDVLSTKLSALDDKMSAQEDKMSAKLSAHEDKMSAKLSAQEDKMSAKLSALDDKMSAIEGMLAQLLKKNEI
ncbi:hypothetical protein THAOC_00512 [Thalassiosira oceanica]|uniref:Uncharacterized protein n=1 Tax=Thalassiosira oceanica TaxID=159749 RepID=K0TRE2_THAOC|nr:hypothetical protein THAOC_00512 [Thalassiosira oceanica]|eukprot:EJK77642.1 hypothetical protein THAOC_00512 [Thalassiosira oceanica]